jgi:two-component system OmpR family sensor kinase
MQESLAAVLTAGKPWRLFLKIFAALWVAIVAIGLGVHFYLESLMHGPLELSGHLAAIALVSLFFSAGMAWHLHGPLRILREANRRLGEGDLTIRVGPQIGDRHDEVSDLAKDFDAMAGRLQSLVTAQKRLLHDVSHEWRSPLARMEVALELAHQTPAKGPEMLHRIGQEIHRLDQLLDEALTLSRLESGAQTEFDGCLQLNGLLADVVADARFEGASAGKRIELVTSEDVLVKGENALLRSAFENVVRNALRYTPEGSSVTVHAGHVECGGEPCVMVRVCDQGTGVPNEERNRIFEPFYRGRNTQDEPGHGLGLAITRRVVLAHGGLVDCSNLPQGGLCVSIRLPVAVSFEFDEE